MTKATIVEPTTDGTCEFSWYMLEIKKSNEPRAGNGVFATEHLKPGLMFPILGTPVSWEEAHTREENLDFTHGWFFDKILEQPIDGDPKIKPYKKIGTFGLAVTMMINEPLYKKPNCIFKLDYVLVAKPIKKGEELTIYYEKDYEPIRKKLGYSLKGNKFLNKFYTHLEDITFPSYEVRAGVFDEWFRVIRECYKINEKKNVVDLISDDESDSETSMLHFSDSGSQSTEFIPQSPPRRLPKGSALDAIRRVLPEFEM